MGTCLLFPGADAKRGEAGRDQHLALRPRFHSFVLISILNSSHFHSSHFISSVSFHLISSHFIAFHRISNLCSTPFKHLFGTCRGYNTCISAVGKMSQWPMALDLFRQLQLNTQATRVTYNSLMASCVGGQWHVALLYFQEMLKGTLTPDEFTYSAAQRALRACMWRY